MNKKKAPQIPEEIHLTDEPRGTAYNSLIDFGEKQCVKFSLVWREDLRIKRQNNEIAKKLEPYIIADTISSTWPAPVRQIRLYGVDNEGTYEGLIESCRADENSCHSADIY